jgi:hypothetical protein
MTKRLRDRAPGLRREAFPALTAFARGYLHEDFPEVHGSARDAAAAFAADAGSEERRQVIEELESLLQLLASLPARAMRRFLTDDLGSRWQPKSREELVEVLEVMRREG